MIIDGAEVLLLSQEGDFGEIKCKDSDFAGIPIRYLAICQYEKDEIVYLFFCNQNLEVEQDDVFDSIADAKKRAGQISANITWEEGYKKISFEDIDFGSENINHIMQFGEDMLEVYYPNGYMIDIGYYDTIETFGITVVKDNDWVNIVREETCLSDIDLKRKLVEIIKFVSQLN